MLWLDRPSSVFEDSSDALRRAAERVATTMDGVAAGRRDAAATFTALAAQSPADRERLSGVAAELIRSAERAETFAASERSKLHSRRPAL